RRARKGTSLRRALQAGARRARQGDRGSRGRGGQDPHARGGSRARVLRHRRRRRLVTQDGNEIRRLGPGDFFGEIALIYDNARRTATVTAASPLRFFVLTRQSFRSLLEHQ